MIKKLIETGRKFNGEFTTEYGYNLELGISSEFESEYIQWLARVGVYAEGNLRVIYPDMTKEIIEIVRKKSTMLKDYNIIIGYLESVDELGF